MRLFKINLTVVFILAFARIQAQTPAYIQAIFPKGTIINANIPYANDTLKKHLLDIYLPPNASSVTPLIIWIHGGAWMFNDKYADMNYMKNTIGSFIEKGYALASIDYRHSTTAIFPAQIKDCNQAVSFLYENATKYKLDKNKFVLMGFSAGGHLASLLALSNNNDVGEFYQTNKKTPIKIRAVLDFYGPSNFLLFFGNSDPNEVHNPISVLLGASPLKRPDLSVQASPCTYVDKNDPPFFIVHGQKDNEVPTAQSYLLKSYLDLANVKNDLTIVKDAPHYGEMFDTKEIRQKLFEFLDAVLK